MGVVRFLWDFVVGDDWVAAAGVVVLLVVAALGVHQASIDPWWVLPPGVVAVLALTLRRAVRRAPG